jgi:hypothetical protein
MNEQSQVNECTIGRLAQSKLDDVDVGLDDLCAAFTEKLIPSPSLVAACLQAYEERKDARLLPPALTGMTRQEVMQTFPHLLYLDPAGFKAALHRLLMPLPPSGSFPPLVHLREDMWRGWS